MKKAYFLPEHFVVLVNIQFWDVSTVYISLEIKLHKTAVLARELFHQECVCLHPTAKACEYDSGAKSSCCQSCNSFAFSRL